MLALLASPDVALFTPLPNACYLQVSGVPISEHKLREPAGADAGKGTPTRTVHRPRKRKRRRRRRDEAGSSNEEDETTGQDSPWPEMQPMIVDEPTSPVRPLPRIEVTASPSPTKLGLSLRPALSAPLLGSGPFQSTQVPAQLASSQLSVTQHSPTKRLRSTQSSVSVFGGSEAAPMAKRKKLETL